MIIRKVIGMTIKEVIRAAEKKNRPTGIITIIPNMRNTRNMRKMKMIPPLRNQFFLTILRTKM